MNDIFAKGHVTLVGAGPGDPDLLTLKALKALQAADVILFDSLVSDQVLDMAKRKAKKLLVGKRGGRPSCKQDDINAIMLALAKQGKNVVRLKSGDPMIFGRAGEEISWLKSHGIAISVIPGITAAMAAAADLGISLTHRDHAQAVKFVTAHSRKGELPELDWRSCADGQTTLMVYMGARTAGPLAEKLLDEGLPEDTPVMIAKGVSRQSQETDFLTLGALTSLTIERSQPVLLGIGWVFAEKLASTLVSHDHAIQNLTAL